MASSSSSDISTAVAIAKASKTAFEASQLIPPSERIKVLLAIRNELEISKDVILAANRKDLSVIHLLSLDVSRLSVLTG